MKPVISYGEYIRVGFESSIYDIDDPDRFTSKLIELFDGTNSVKQIAQIMSIQEEEIYEAIGLFDNIGLLEDAEINGTEYFNTLQLNRYRANLTFFSNFSSMKINRYHFQENLNNSTVAILGLGAASLDLASLAGLGVGNIIGIDYDTVDISNLNRQFMYTEKDIGNLKSKSAYTKARDINSDINIKTFNMKVTDSKGLFEVIKDADIVINGIDTPGIIANRWVNSACVELNIPIIQGGISNTNIIWERIIPNESGCYDCFLIDYLRKDSLFEKQLMSLYNQTFERRNTAIAPHVALLSGFITSEVAKYISNYSHPMPASESFILDTTTMQIKSGHKWERLSECPTCGVNKGLSIEPININDIISIAKQESNVL